MNFHRSKIVTGLGFGALLIAGSTLGVVPSQDDGDGAPTIAAPPAAFVVSAGGRGLERTIAQLEERVARVPNDHVAQASLGMAYVQQARVSGETELRVLAQRALDASLEINESDNFLAHAALSSLSSGQHDFMAARAAAERGLEINPYSPILWGALSDAQIQLGRYDEAAESAQRMLDLSPDASALARASYLRELRGDIPGATNLMQRSLEAAPTAADRSFAHLQLGNLAFNAGEPARALEHYAAALTAVPDSAPALVGRAHALAALDRIDVALGELERLVARGSEPFYRLDYAKVLEAVGRADEAAVQYRRFREEETAMAANEPVPHAAFTIFLADHGGEELALSLAERAVEVAPFLDAHDAYAWALHRNGRHEEAWIAMQQALELGMHSALFEYHAGMIRHALGDDRGARDHLARALAINPHFDPVAAVEAEETLAQIGG